ncbi:PLP-dependent aminotransferase family protein [Aciduricibacillus chroicocephali]|uniref:PLP-dependent aminotransferase family protein n=1 Tax=Aciduricibacillus chroicocephali TaxID=3054939 RepID=A0ABY9KVM1_9BACI|nr:PLP-dependent aminotransferase family protein [Bacillaceae bacterium 44XB]
MSDWREMKTLLFSLTETEAKHRQIYEQIRNRIENGQLVEDSQLPSIRQLADLLEVSRNTTLQAYEQLAAEGYIRSEPKRGYYVQKFIPIYLKQEAHKQTVQELAEEKYSIDFRTGIIDQTAFPLNRWRQCANKVLNEDMIYGYGEPFGDKFLREQLAEYLMRSRGVFTTSEAIIIGSSTQSLLMQLSILLKEDYKSLAVEEPGYDGASYVFELQGFTIEPVKISPIGISLDELAKARSRLLYLTPSHQFPTGATIPIPERQQLIKWAKEHQAYIIEDDYDSEFMYQHQPVPALSSFDSEGRVIYISTFSKAFLPAIRISYMILPPSLIEVYKKKMFQLEQSASMLHQRALARFMKEGYWDSHLRKMRARYKAKMAALIETLRQTFDERLNIIGQQAGLYIIVQVNTNLDETTLIQKAKDYSVKVYSTKPYFKGPYPDKPLFQLGFANLSIEQIIEGVTKLSKAWHEL